MRDSGRELAQVRQALGEKALDVWDALDPDTVDALWWATVHGTGVWPQHDGLEVFAPTGRAFKFPAWSIDRVLQPWIVRRGIYRGVRDR